MTPTQRPPQPEPETSERRKGYLSGYHAGRKHQEEEIADLQNQVEKLTIEARHYMFQATLYFVLLAAQVVIAFAYWMTT